MLGEFVASSKGVQVSGASAADPDSSMQLIVDLDSFRGLTWGEVKIEETGAKFDDLNSWTLCVEPKGFGGAMGDRLSTKSKIGESP